MKSGIVVKSFLEICPELKGEKFTKELMVDIIDKSYTWCNKNGINIQGMILSKGSDPWIIGTYTLKQRIKNFINGLRR